MIVNLTVILITLISGYLIINKKGINANNSKNRKNYIIFISIILILQSGLRNLAVGADTYAYYMNFENVKGYTWVYIFEINYDYFINGFGKDPGYIIFQKIIQYFLPYNQLFLFLIAIIFFTALGNFLYQNTTRLGDSIFAFVLYSTLFYHFFSITGHRQTLATAAALWSYKYVKERKLLPFLFLMLLASTIHKSCLVFIPFYFLANLKNTKHYYLFILLISPFLMLFRHSVASIFASMSGYEVYGNSKNAGTFTFTLIIISIAIFGLWRMKATLISNRQVKNYFNAFIIAIAFIPLTWVNPVAMRIVQYFSIFLMVLIPPLLRSFTPKTNRIMYATALLLLLFFALKSQVNMEYKFFWQEMELGANYR